MEKVNRKAVVRELMSIHPLFRKKFLNRLDRPFGGLSKSQRDVVMSLNLYPAMNMGQLAVEANVSLQQITKTVNALEDIGFFCIDNIPAGLLPRILDFAQQGENQLSRVAVVMDIRGLHSVQETNEALEALDEKKMPYDILFLDASDAAIRRRYKETRRVHPMTISEGIPVSEAITKERQILQPLRERAKYVIDTSLLSTAQNRERVSSLFLQKGQCAMSINVVSFGFKYGLPQEADIVFDVRCLPNPFYVPELKEKTGLDQEVVDYVMKFPESQELLRRIESFLEYALPLYVKEGKSQLMIAIGCTGGKHRSITFARKIGEYCTKLGYQPSVQHRDARRTA